MIDYWLEKYEGQQLELFRNHGNPYETIIIRIQLDEQELYVGDEDSIRQAFNAHPKDNTVFLPRVMSRKKQVIPMLSDLWG